jgi:hypothetical protein
MQPPALIFVDGIMLMKLSNKDDIEKIFNQVVTTIGGEVVLAVHDPTNDMYLKYKMSFSERKVIK